jgi:hypothetical protein
VDKAGGTVDFFLSRNRDVTAAKTFLRSAMRSRRTPTKITLDAYAASHRAVREMKETGELSRRVKVRSSFDQLLEPAAHSSRGCAFGDFDNDGDTDVLIVNLNEPPSLRATICPAPITGSRCNSSARRAIGARSARERPCGMARGNSRRSCLPNRVSILP